MQKNEQVDILLVLRTPPPVGGGEIRAMHAKKYFSDKSGYLVFDYSLGASDKSSQGKATLANIKRGIFWIYNTCKLIMKHRPKAIYFGLGQDFGSFARNSVGALWAKLFGVRVLAELAGTSFLFLENKSSPLYHIGLLLLRQVDDMRLLSPRIRDMFLQYKLPKITVYANGVTLPQNIEVNPDVFKAEILPLLYIGTLEQSKGVLNLVEALALCIKAGLKVHLNLLGEWSNQEDKDTCNKCIKDNNLEEHLTFHGVQTGEKKWEIFKNCALLVHPTFWDGVPLTILESMGIGLGVISTRVGGIPDTLIDGEGGYILEKSEPTAVVECIKKLVEDRGLLKKL
ncbi:MAG: glycosyltransferase, partial [Candidatus Cloacimonetes bacterium]|nr:glycosyltransferase [Candidatus Cloacimonadota bacterium]